MINLEQKYNRNDFLGFLNLFVPEFTQVVRPIVDIKGLKVTKDAFLLGESKALDLYVFELVYSSTNNAHDSLASDGFKVMKSRASYRALVIYHTTRGADWRLSLMTATLSYNQKGKICQSFSLSGMPFSLGPNAIIDRPHQLLIERGPVKDFAELQKRFSQEVVNRYYYPPVQAVSENAIVKSEVAESVPLELQPKPVDKPYQPSASTDSTNWYRIGFTTAAIILGIGLGYYFNITLLSVISTVIISVLLGIGLYYFWQSKWVRYSLLGLSIIPIFCIMAITNPGFLVFQMYPMFRIFVTRISSAFGGATLAGTLTFFILAQPLARSKDKKLFLLVAIGIAIIALILGIKFAS